MGLLYITNPQLSSKCEVSFKGKTTRRGEAKITSVTFAGNTACAGTTATGLPWRVLASGPTLGKIVNFGFVGSYFGTCNPGTIPFTDDASGLWTLNGSAPPCTVNGAFPTSPPITIVP